MGSGTGAPAICVEGLSKAFGSRPVLEGVSFRVTQGEVVALTGGNGSGKTTLLRILAGLSTPTAGRVEILGGPAWAGNPAVGYLPQRVQFDPLLTCAEVLEFFGRLKGLNKDQVAQAGALLGVDRFLTTPVGVLSGGMTQRLALAVALMGGPRLVLLDEPAAALDADGLRRLSWLLSDLRRASVTALIATHLPVPFAHGGHDLSHPFSHPYLLSQEVDRMLHLDDGTLQEAALSVAAPEATARNGWEAMVHVSRP